jgi:hypothetical protein
LSVGTLSESIRVPVAKPQYLQTAQSSLIFNLEPWTPEPWTWVVTSIQPEARKFSYLNVGTALVTVRFSGRGWTPSLHSVIAKPSFVLKIPPSP